MFFSLFSPEAMLVWNGSGFAPLVIHGMAGAGVPVNLGPFAPTATELWMFLPDPFVALVLLDWRFMAKEMCCLCVLVGTSIAISKVCTFG